MSEAWSLWKDIAYPGDVVVPHPDTGKPLRYQFTRQDLRQLKNTNQKKIQAGWNVPLCWEHQDVEPSKRIQLSQGEKDRDFALGIFGNIADYDLTPDGRLKALLTGRDPKDREQLEKVGFVSPEIQWNWRDSDGKVWHGPTVTHLAATARPVQPHQNAIGTDPDTIPPRLQGRLADCVRMSCTSHASHKATGVALRLRLSLESYTAGTRRKYRGSNSMADKVNEDTPANAGGDATDAVVDGAGAGGKQSWMEKIATALADHCGLELGDVKDCKDPEHFAKLVEVAAMNYKAGGEPGEGFDEDNPEEEEDEGNAPEGDLETPPEGSTPPETPPVQMSLEAQKQLALQKQELEGTARTNLHNRIDRLEKTGRVTAAKAVEMRKQADTVRLSFSTKTFKVEPNELIMRIEAREETLAGSAGPLTPRKPGKKPTKPAARLSQLANERPTNTVPVETSPYQEQTDADADAVANSFLKHVYGNGSSLPDTN